MTKAGEKNRKFELKSGSKIAAKIERNIAIMPNQLPLFDDSGLLSPPKDNIKRIEQTKYVPDTNGCASIRNYNH